MRKRLVFVLLFLFASALKAYAVVPCDLKFSPVGGGMYIYENNNEAIRRQDLSDTSNPQPSYLMNNDEMKAGKYSLFVSHINHTGITDANNQIVQLGFDIEVDVQFKAKQDTVLTITAIGFEVPHPKRYYYNQNQIVYQDSWVCLNAWADYLKMPIYQIKSDKYYPSHAFEPKKIQIKQGEEIWLSSIIENYREVPYKVPVHLVADFEIESGSADVNIAALKHSGSLRDRSHHDNNAKQGVYYRDKQYKGIADTLPAVDVKLDYTVDDTVNAGTLLPVTVYNQYNPTGNPTEKWYTHINPQEDIWARNTCAESDMLAFRFFDRDKLKYYGAGVDENNKDPYWYFDVFHSDTKGYDGAATGYAFENYIPNYPLSIERNNIGYSCNLGNFGVSEYYKITVRNTGEKARYINYKLNTASNNLVILRDENGTPMQSYGLCKGELWEKREDVMASVELPPKQETTFMVQVILPTNNPGGMQNSFEITDKPYDVSVKKANNHVAEQKQKYTGKEYIRWQGGELWVSQNLKDWTQKSISPETKKLFDSNWSNYEIKSTGIGYLVKWQAYDGQTNYYLEMLEHHSTIYYLDHGFRYLGSHTFAYYPHEVSFAKGYYFAKTDRNYYSADGVHWQPFDLPRLPKYNNGKFCALAGDGEVYWSGDGLGYSKVMYAGAKPNYISALDGWYYYTDYNKLYLSTDAIYWTQINSEKESIIDTVDIFNDVILINGNEKIPLPIRPQSIYVKLDEEILGFDQTPIIENGRTLVPVRLIFERLGAHVEWEELSRTVSITKDNTAIHLTIDNPIALINGVSTILDTPPRQQNGRTLVPVRFLAEALQKQVEWDEEKYLVNIQDSLL